MFGFKKKKKTEVREQVFKKAAYIPKKRLNKKERTLQPVGKKGRLASGIKSKGKGRKILVFILWTLFVGEIIYVLLFAHFFTIESLEIQREGGTEELSLQTIHEYTEQFWQGNWLGVLSKNNLLLLRSQALEHRIKERFPKLSEVEVRRQFPQKLQIVLTEKPYQTLLCRGANCVLVDASGKAEGASVFFQYPEEQGKVVRIEDTLQEPLEAGKEVIHPTDRLFLQDLVADFTLRTELKIEGSVERPNPYAREMRIRTNKDFVLFFNTELPVSQSLNSLMLFLEKEVPESEWEKIDYIDLRTENRIYYTRKDRAPEKTEEQKKREEEKQKEEEQKRKEEEEKARQGM